MEVIIIIILAVLFVAWIDLKILAVVVIVGIGIALIVAIIKLAIKENKARRDPEYRRQQVAIRNKYSKKYSKGKGKYYGFNNKKELLIGLGASVLLILFMLYLGQLK